MQYNAWRGKEEGIPDMCKEQQFYCFLVKIFKKRTGTETQIYILHNIKHKVQFKSNIIQ